MKKIIYSVAGLGLLALNLDAHGDDRDFNETRTIAATDEYSLMALVTMMQEP